MSAGAPERGREPGVVVGAGTEIGEDVLLGSYAVIGEHVAIGDEVRIGAHAVIHEGVSIGEGTQIGAHAVIREGSVIGEGCVIEEHALLGKQPRLAADSRAHGRAGRLRLHDRVSVCAGAVLFAGASVLEGAIIGDQAYVRERSVVGERSVIGRGSAVDNDVLIAANVKVQTGVYLTAFSVLEDDVFVGPGATTTNDHTMARHGPESPLRGATLRRACRIGGATVITPGVEVGEEAFLAAGAVLTRDLPPRAVAMGVPARVVGEVGEEDLIEMWR